MHTRHRAVRVALLLLSVTLAACEARATEYYVSSTNPSRSDSNAGTSPAAPWASFTKVMNAWGTTIRAGDTVHLERGSAFTVSTRWIVRAGGSDAAGPITIRGDDYGSGAKPRVRRTASSGDAFVDIKAGGYVTLRDFVLDGGSDLGIDAAGIIVGSADQTAPISHVNILNMTLENLAYGAVYCSGIHLVPHNGYAVTDCLIEGNDVSGFTTWGLNHYQDKVGQKTQSLLNNITWRNNWVHNPSASRWPNVNGGIHLMSGGSGNIVEYNYVEGSYEMGLLTLSNCVNDENDLRVRYNVFKGNTQGYGIQVVEDTGGANVDIEATFHGNLIVGCRLSGITVGSSDYFSGVFNFYNNTLYNNHQDAAYPSWGPVYNGGEIWAGSGNPRITVNLRNNLIVHTAANGNARACLSLHNWNGTLTHANNLYWHASGGGATAIYVNGAVYTVNQAGTYEPTSQHADPMFTDAASVPPGIDSVTGIAGDGFAPRIGSPALDNGAALAAAFAGSINNLVRPQGAGWDIGAYEAGEAIALPPAAPDGLVATPVSSTRIDVSWQDNAPDETGYRLERGADGTVFALLANLAAGATAYADTGLQPGETWYYRVRAERDADVSAYSATAQATTPAAPDTTAPALAWVRPAGDPSRILVAFDEPVADVDVGDVTIGGITAVRGVQTVLNVAVLNVAPSLSDQRTYLLAVSNVADLAGNVMPAGVQTSFVFRAIDPALTAWLPLEGDGADYSGQGRDAVVYGAVPLASGRIGQAFALDGADDYIQVPLAGITSAEGTVALWMRPNTFRDMPEYIFGHTSQTGWSDRIQLYTDDAGGTLDVGLGDRHALATAIALLTPGVWHHVALTWKAGTYRVYVDGEERASGAYVGLATLNAFADAGNTGNVAARAEAFDGAIDDIRFYKRALEPAEIAVLAAPVTVPLPPSAPRMLP